MINNIAIHIHTHIHTCTDTIESSISLLMFCKREKEEEGKGVIEPLIDYIKMNFSVKNEYKKCFNITRVVSVYRRVNACRAWNYGLSADILL